MNWQEVSKVVGALAPLAGTLVGGPAGTALGGLLASALGVSATPDAVHAAIAADPEAALKLATFESDNKVKLQAMAFAHADNELAAQTAAIQADVADRASARAREIAVKDWTPPALAWFVIVSSLALSVAVVMGVVTKDPTQATLVGTVVGYVMGEAKAVMAYYFGSSSGSARKTEIMATTAQDEVKSGP